MSRLVLAEEDYYVAREEDALPLRWMAVESMANFKFSLRTDVWSYGIVCYEVFSHGGVPYGALNPMVLPSEVERGVRPEQPTDCPAAVYDLMRSCWDAVPAQRPTFREIYTRMASMHEGLIKNSRGQPQRDVAPLLRYIRKGDPADLKLALKGTGETADAANSDDEDPDDPYKKLEGDHKVYVRGKDMFLPPLAALAPAPAAEPSSSTGQDGLDHLPYFHGPITRPTAERLLTSQGRPHELEGCFLVRRGASNQHDLALSVIFDGKTRHYRIQAKDTGGYYFYGRDYATLEQLIQEHKTNRNKLMGLLRTECNRAA